MEKDSDKDHIYVYTIRTYHKWSAGKWKERLRVGVMSIQESKSDFHESLRRGYSENDCTKHGAN